MEFSASGPAAIPIILLGFAIPLIIFVVIPVIVIRSIIKAIKSNLPEGATFGQLRDMASQFPQGTNWQGLAADWDIKVDPLTKKIILRRKAGVNQVSGSNSPQEIQIDSFAQLPETLKKLIPPSDPSANMPISEGIEFTSRETKTPVSATSAISRPSTVHPSQKSPAQNYELIQTIKKVALIIGALWLFYTFKGYFM